MFVRYHLLDEVKNSKNSSDVLYQSCCNELEAGEPPCENNKTSKIVLTHIECLDGQANPAQSGSSAEPVLAVIVLERPTRAAGWGPGRPEAKAPGLKPELFVCWVTTLRHCQCPDQDRFGCLESWGSFSSPG